jgi:hypothetical protein
MQQLDSLVPHFKADEGCDPCNIASGSRQARDNTRLNGMAENSNNRDYGSRRLEIEYKFIANGDDQIRLMGNDIPSQVRIVRSTPFA